MIPLQLSKAYLSWVCTSLVSASAAFCSDSLRESLRFVSVCFMVSILLDFSSNCLVKWDMICSYIEAESMSSSQSCFAYKGKQF